ncbi:TolC family protein [Aquimarina mytili]|uniref:TolC family protein n=1 Tax=Aquimarina mytili TaxID=874423 RepID=A0A936ZUR3_9FLAO|nr:TolC family protein [Aquimarina mytili]MBL0685053.1 TolC family protein [Aquimarina mytili]
MNQNIKILGVLFLIMMNSSLFSQQKWSLEDCISYALSHNLELNNLQYNIQSNKETHRQSMRSLLPNINGAVDYGIRYGRSADPNTNSIVDADFFSNNYLLEFDMDLFRGFQKLNTIKASKLIYQASKEESEQQKYLLGFRVMAAFYDILFFEGALKISQEQESISQSNYDLVSKKVTLGISAKSDLYDSESLLLADKLEVTRSENNLRTAKLKLIQEMNLLDRTDIEIQSEIPKNDSITNPLEVQTDDVYNKAMDFLPIIEANKLKVEAAKKQVQVSKANYYPSLTLFGGVGSGYFETNTDDLGNTISFNQQFENNMYKYVGLSLKIPITNGWTTRSDVKQKKIELLRAKNDLKVQEQELLRTIQDLVLELQSLEAEYSQSNLKVKSQNLAFNTAQKKYEKGMVSAIELFTAKNTFAQAQNENLQIKLSLEVNKNTLAFYQGLSIFNIK